MVLSSIGNERDYEKIEAALIFQHPTIEKSETPTRSSPKTYSPKGHGKSPYKEPPHHMKPHQKKVWVQRTANLADGEEAEVWQEVWLGEDEGEAWPEVPEWPVEDDGGTDWEEGDAEAYLSQFDDFAARAATLEEELYDDIDEGEVFEMNCYFAAYEESSEDHGQIWDDRIADMIQQDYEAYFAKGGGKGKGKSKGKGKGKKPTFRGSSMSIEDRRKKLAEVKARTKCRK